MINEELLNVQWYPVVNDLIGGWAVASVDEPCSKLDYENGEHEIADFAVEQIAKHIANLHNEDLRRRGLLPAIDSINKSVGRITMETELVFKDTRCGICRNPCRKSVVQISKEIYVIDKSVVSDVETVQLSLCNTVIGIVCTSCLDQFLTPVILGTRKMQLLGVDT